MNVRLKKVWNVCCGVIWDGRYRINQYTVMANLTTRTADHTAQNIAYERMNYWILQILQDSVLINRDSDRIAAFQATEQQVITIPGEPVDQLIGMMLFSKLTAIVEQRLVIDEIEISSDLGDRVIYSHDCDESSAQFAQSGWWNDPGPCHSEVTRRKGSKVINLARSTEWGIFGLGWDAAPGDATNTVVFAEFTRHEDQ